MKQGLSLRVSQHLALTPQLQQSIRLLQLSTLEMSQEVEQMLDDNPFLERSDEEAEREAYGLAQADTPPGRDDRDGELATVSSSSTNVLTPPNWRAARSRSRIFYTGRRWRCACLSLTAPR